MTDYFIPTLTDLGYDLRAGFANGRVQQMTERKPKLLHQIEYTPDADSQTIVAPSKISWVRLRPKSGRSVAKPLAKTKVLDIECDVKCKAFALRPIKAGTLNDR